MEPTVYLRSVLVLFLLLGLILLLGVLGRRYGLSMLGGALRRPGARPRRLRVEESLPLDARRRLVLVSRDGIQHLLLIGGAHDLVVERDIAPPRFTPDAPAPVSKEAPTLSIDATGKTGQDGEQAS